MKDITSLRISVIIPVYNVEKYLHECLDSVCNQTLREIEIICIDDGSTDGSLQILKDYALKDSRITILTQKNRGAGAARNLGLECAKGEYLSFLDSDDFFELKMLELTYNKAQELDADIVIYRAQTFHQETKKTQDISWGYIKELFPKKTTFSWQDFPEHVFQCFQNWTWNKLFRTTFIKENNISFQPLFRTNDMLFTITALVNAKKITTLDKTLANYRIGTENNSQSTNDKYPLDFYKAYLATKEMLISKGVYKLVEKTFLLECLGAIYNLNSCKTYEGFKTVYSHIKENMESDFALQKNSDEYYRFYASAYDIYKRVQSKSIAEFLFNNITEVKQSSDTAITRLQCDLDLEKLYVRAKQEEVNTLMVVLQEKEIHISKLQSELEKEKENVLNKSEKINSLNIQLNAEKNISKKYKKELSDLRLSLTWRIGRFILFIPRKILGRK